MKMDYANMTDEQKKTFLEDPKNLKALAEDLRQEAARLEAKSALMQPMSCTVLSCVSFGL